MLALLPIGLFAALFGTVGLLAWRQPLLARLAWREALRRRGQSLLVIAGLMVSSAAIATAFVTADTAREVIVVNTYRGAAHVDATITAGGGPFPATVADQLAADPQVAAAVEGVQAGAELVTGVANLDRERRRSPVRLVGFDPGAQGPFGAFELTDGSTTDGVDLGRGEVLLTTDLAGALDAEVGDRLHIPVEGAPGGSFEATVAGIAEATGPGVYGLQPSVFVPLETLWEATGPDVATVVRVTAAGAVREGVAEAEAALPVLTAAVGLLDVPVELTVSATKANALEEAETSWPVLFMTAMSMAMAAIVVTAGLTLSVALAHMLAEDRRSQLGVLRALGMRGQNVVRLAVVEGALYSLVAATVGVVVGVVAGRLVASRLLFAITAGEEISELTFVFSVRPLTVAAALALGASVTLVTLGAASRRTAHMSVVAAVRGLPEHAATGQGGWRRTALVGGLVLAGVAGMAVPVLPVRTLAGFMLVMAAAVVLRHRLPTRVHASATGAGLIGWAGVMVATAAIDDPGVFLGVWAIAVIGVVFGLTLVVAANLQVLESVIGRAGGRLRATLRPPVAELARRPVRTGLATGAFALALAVVALLAALQSMLPQGFAAEVGDTDILAQGFGSGLVDLPPSVADAIDHEVTLPTLSYLGPFERTDRETDHERFVTVMVVPDTVVRSGAIELIEIDEDYASAEEAWTALGAGPDLAVAVNAAPGDTLTLQGRDGPTSFTVVATASGDLVGWDTVLVGEAAQQRFADLPLGTTMLLGVRPGADIEAVAAEIERALFAHGIEVRTMASLIEEVTGYVLSMFAGIDVFVRFALVVGVATTGILALRAVVERRRMIGVLRAIGYRRRQIVAGLVSESLLLAAIGTAVGMTAGLFTGALLLNRAIPEAVGFSAAPRPVAAAVLLVVIATAVVTAGPAIRAGRVPPAEAIRLLE